MLIVICWGQFIEVGSAELQCGHIPCYKIGVGLRCETGTAEIILLNSMQTSKSQNCITFLSNSILHCSMLDCSRYRIVFLMMDYFCVYFLESVSCVWLDFCECVFVAMHMYVVCSVDGSRVESSWVQPTLTLYNKPAYYFAYLTLFLQTLILLHCVARKLEDKKQLPNALPQISGFAFVLPASPSSLLPPAKLCS